MSINSTSDPSAAPRGSPCADALEMLWLGHEQTRALADECRRFARHMNCDPAMQDVAEALAFRHRLPGRKG